MRMRNFYSFQTLHTEGSPIDSSEGTERGDIRVDYVEYTYLRLLLSKHSSKLIIVPRGPVFRSINLNRLLFTIFVIYSSSMFMYVR